MTQATDDVVERPFGYAYRYPSGNGQSVIRYGTGGREINASKPLEAIPLYSKQQVDATIRQLRADNAALREERDALLEKPISLSKMDSIDDETASKMVAYYWCEQAEIARDVAQELQAKVDEAWQPIETAPRGEWLLFFIPDEDDHLGRTHAGRYSEISNGHMLVIGHHFAYDLAGKPTHWQPLPAPPAALSPEQET